MPALVAYVPQQLCTASSALHGFEPATDRFSDAALDYDGAEWEAGLGAIMVDQVEGKARWQAASLSKQVINNVQDTSESEHAIWASELLPALLSKLIWPEPAARTVEQIGSNLSTTSPRASLWSRAGFPTHSQTLCRAMLASRRANGRPHLVGACRVGSQPG